MYENSNLFHNHPLDYNLYKGYNQNRKLDGEDVVLVKTLIEAKTRVNKILRGYRQYRQYNSDYDYICL